MKIGDLVRAPTLSTPAHKYRWEGVVGIIVDTHPNPNTSDDWVLVFLGNEVYTFSLYTLTIP